MIRALKWILAAVAVLVIIYMLGPQPSYPTYDLKPKYLKVQLKNLEDYVSEKERNVEEIKPDNEARIIWHGDTVQTTEYALVYLHGFSSSQEEGDPIHKDFAQRYGMNMYLSRLADHGRSSDDSFKDLTPKDLIESAKEAIAIGSLLGEKVILMSCSTGSTYSIMLAPSDDRVEALIMYSPNIGLADPMAKLVTYPWGKQILKAVMGGDHNRIEYPKKAQQYWNSTYHIDGILAVQSLIADGMDSDFYEEVDIPYFIGCYYKDEEHQDNVVSVDAMIDFHSHTSTPKNLSQFEKFPDAGRHVFSSHIMVDDFENIKSKTYDFAESVLNLQIY